MTKQPFVRFSMLAMLGPAILSLSCGLKRNWDVCDPPKAMCKDGYTCTAGLRCVRTPDGGLDSALALDGRSANEPIVIDIDGPMSSGSDAAVGPALGPDAGQPDQIPVSPSLDGPEPDRPSVAPSPDASAPISPDIASAAPDAPVAKTPDAPQVIAQIDGPAATPDTTPVASPADAPINLPDGPSPDAPGSCSVDKDCAGRSGTPACSAGGRCVACTESKHCTGAASTCDTAANQCVSCLKRSDCAGACQTCTNGTCTAADEGMSCNGDQYCNLGTCKAGCFISGAYYANGAVNPANPCQTCRTTYALTSWTTTANGDSCGTGQVCSGGTCQSGCWIEGALVGSETTNSSNRCQICRPTASTSVWSSNANGTSCGGGRICGAGACQCATGTDCGTSGCINVNGSDSSHCGSCTNVCPAGQSCSSGKCACAMGAPACSGCLAWDFEWGSNPSPWSLELSPDLTSPNGATNIGITQSKSHGGNSSLIAPIGIDGDNTHLAEITVSLPCKVNLSGYSGWAYVYFSGSYPLTDWANQLVVDTWNSSGTGGDHVVPYFGNIPTNEWFKLDLGFTSSVPVDRIGIILTPSANWTGTMYVDDVVVNAL